MMRVSGWVSGVVLAVVLGVTAPAHAAPIDVASVRWTLVDLGGCSPTAPDACESFFELTYEWADNATSLPSDLPPPVLLEGTFSVVFANEGPLGPFDFLPLLNPGESDPIALTYFLPEVLDVPVSAEATIVFDFGGLQTITLQLLTGSLFDEHGAPTQLGISEWFTFDPDDRPPVSVPEPSTFDLSMVGLLVVLAGLLAGSVRT